jgi:putative ABC transport system permease protein
MVGRPPEVTKGRLEDLKIADAIMVEESALGKLGNPKVGDTLKLNDRRAVVVGYCRAKFGWDSPAVVYTTYENAITFTPLGRNKLSFILVGVKPEVPVPQVQAAISRLPDLKAFTPNELRLQTIFFIMKETGIGINFGITVALGVIVGLTVSAAIFYQFTLENLRHFAVIKAMGATNRVLLGMVLTQAALIGIVGFGIGVGGAGLFSLSARKPGAELAAYFPWQLLLVGLGGTVACLAIGSLLSLKRVLTLDPAVVFKS